MALTVKGKPSSTPAGDESEETDDEFEERIYLALMRVARTTTAKTRNALGACVMLGTPFAAAPEDVKETIREFVEEADL